MADATQPLLAVTGASGLLGRHLCDHFRKMGWRVNALVRDTGRYPFREPGVVVHALNLPDRINPASLEGVDVLIHCAYTTVFKDKDEAKRVNEEGTARLLKLARTAGVKTFVFVSSLAADPAASSYYAQSKFRLEALMDPARDLIVRPGLILADDGGLFSRIVGQVRRLPVLPLFGGGDQRLHTVHVDDLCRAFEWALANHPRGLVTVADEDGITMRALLASVACRLARRRAMIPLPGRPFVVLLKTLEGLKLKLPVSSENLLGLMGLGARKLPSGGVKAGVRIRPFQESMRDLHV